MAYQEPRYLRRRWAEFTWKLDNAQFSVEVAQSLLTATHICSATHWPEVGFASVLVGDVQDILTYGQR